MLDATRPLISRIQGLLPAVSDAAGVAEALTRQAGQLGDQAVEEDLHKILDACGALRGMVLAPERMLLSHGDDSNDVRRQARHELRTPINVIKGYGEMLVEDAEDGANPLLLTDLKRLVRMADDLLLDIDGLFRDNQAQTPHSIPDGYQIACEAPEHLPAEHAGAQGRILAVDDIADNLAVLSRRLERLGYSVATTTSGKEALQLLQDQDFDLVLLDLMMPEISGYEVLSRIKSSPQTADIPVVMISALNETASVVRCIELGADDYLLKPFDATLLRARVGASLEKKALRDEVLAWNRTLEKRVQEQVAQLDRLGRLKGFFSPQLAESIVSGGGEELLKAHRRKVVVVFLDLRGFTVFTETSEPEEVMSMLGEFHRAMGQLIMAHGGTLERFAGDGLMIFFNDPIPLDDPEGSAVRMALEMQASFATLRAAWTKRCYDLDLGIGIAQGYATLGAIGFEGRWDYACIGSVTNLAARLCSAAKGGQILTNGKMLARVGADVEAASQGDLALKGIAQPVPVFNITGFKRPPG